MWMVGKTESRHLFSQEAFDLETKKNPFFQRPAKKKDGLSCHSDGREAARKNLLPGWDFQFVSFRKCRRRFFQLFELSE